MVGEVNRKAAKMAGRLEVECNLIKDHEIVMENRHALGYYDITPGQKLSLYCDD